MSTATINPITEKPAETASEILTETLQTKLSNPASTPDFDLLGSVNEVLKDVGTHNCRWWRQTYFLWPGSDHRQSS